MFRVAKLHPDAQVPVRADQGSAGLDLCTVEDVVIEGGEQAAVPTGLAIDIPSDVYGRIAPRSGLALKSRIHVMAGVVDSGYRGEIRVILANLGQKPVAFKKGDRIAQLILEKISILEPCEVPFEELSKTERGEGGFGSTGMGL